MLVGTQGMSTGRILLSARVSAVITHVYRTRVQVPSGYMTSASPAQGRTCMACDYLSRTRFSSLPVCMLHQADEKGVLAKTLKKDCPAESVIETLFH